MNVKIMARILLKTILVILPISASANLVDVPVVKYKRYYNKTYGDHLSRVDGQNIPSGYVFEKYSWYILPASSSLSQSFPIYSLLLSGDKCGGYYRDDHMTSLSNNEGGYSFEFQLGRLLNFSDAGQGLYAIKRGYLPRCMFADHLDLGFAESPPSGGVVDGPLGYGWITSGRSVADTTTATIDTVSKYGIKMGASFAWGGAIVQVVKKGIEYINRHDAGREMQSALHYTTTDPNFYPNGNPSPTSTQDKFDYNPTEAGSEIADGSPLINYEMRSANGEIMTQTNALLWNSTISATPNAPMVSGTVLGKDVIVSDSSTISYSSWVVFGRDMSFQSASGGYGGGGIEINTAYINTLFDSVGVYLWDASNYRLIAKVPISSVSSNLGYWDASYLSLLKDNLPHSVYIVAWNNAKDKAYALLSQDNSLSNVNDFSFYRYEPNPSSTDPAGDNTFKITISHSYTEQHHAGEWMNYQTYALVGTLSEVTAAANRLGK